MPEIDRSSFLNSLEPEPEEPPSPVYRPIEIPDGPAPDPVLVDAGWFPRDSEWPVRPDVVKSYFDQEFGLQTRAKASRWKEREKCIVQDTNKVPPEKNFCKRYSCSQRHFGLCFTRDAAFYGSALAMATSLERYFQQDRLSEFFKLYDPADPGNSIIVFFAHH
eukprot:5906470-Pyramimonas_sp.AAC.1